MRRPSSRYAIIVAMLTIIGAFGLEASASSTELYGGISSSFSALASETACSVSYIHQLQRDPDLQAVSYIDKSHAKMIKKVDGEQTKEPGPRGKLAKSIPSPFGTLMAFLQKLAMIGPSVMDSPCFISIDQLPLDNRPPPLCI